MSSKRRTEHGEAVAAHRAAKEHDGNGPANNSPGHDSEVEKPCCTPSNPRVSVPQQRTKQADSAPHHQGWVAKMRKRTCGLFVPDLSTPDRPQGVWSRRAGSNR
jgi:hypothetical protein